MDEGCIVCPECGYPALTGTGMTSFGGAPEKLVCLWCGALLDGVLLIRIMSLMRNITVENFA